MFLIRSLLVVLFLVVSTGPVKAAPEIFKVGAFLTNIYDISFSKQEFSATFWVWFLHSGKYKNPEELFEIVNGKDLRFFHKSHFQFEDGRFLSLAKVSAKMIEKWDLKNFPFDAHALQIKLEVLGHDAKTISYESDCKNSIILEQTIKDSLDGWHVVAYDVPVGIDTYPSSFGNPFPGEYDSFSTITPTLYIKRNWFPEFARLFSVLYFSFLFAVVSLLLPAERIGSKMTMVSISVATIIVSKFVVDAYLPSSGGFSLYSTIEMATLWLIFIMVAYEIFKFLNNKTPSSKKEKVVIFGSFLVGYVILNGALLFYRYNEYQIVFKDIIISCDNTTIQK